jgi:hydrogenase expression/formation protein HypC
MCLGVPGRLAEIREPIGGLSYGLVEFAGTRCTVCLECVPDARPGDYVLVHAGVALSVIDPEEARQVLAYLEAMGETEDRP